MDVLAACEQGLITAWWPHHLGRQQVPRHEFSDADVEIESDTLLLPNGEQRRKGGVYLNQAEYDGWLDDWLKENAPQKNGDSVRETLAADGQSETQTAEPAVPLMNAPAPSTPMDTEAGPPIRAPQQAQTPKKYQRYASDDALVTEAVDGINTGKFANAWRAAQDLAPRAEGPETARAFRLHKKISEAFKASAP